MKITQALLTNHNRPKKKLLGIKGVIWHWTGNKNVGADARANRGYFNTTTRACGAHLVIDDKEILQCIPFDELAYHVGANRYAAIGKMFLKYINGRLYTPNFFLIGMELCVNADGDFAKTYENALDATVYLLEKYNLTVNDVFRHYDITGKNCPAMFVDEKEWARVKRDLKRKMEGDKMKAKKVPVLIKNKSVEGLLIENVTYVPIRPTAAVLGMNVTWNQKEGKVTVE